MRNGYNPQLGTPGMLEELGDLKILLMLDVTDSLGGQLQFEASVLHDVFLHYGELSPVSGDH
jgi:hypothetical protein